MDKSLDRVKGHLKSQKRWIIYVMAFVILWLATLIAYVSSGGDRIFRLIADVCELAFWWSFAFGLMSAQAKSRREFGYLDGIDDSLAAIRDAIKSDNKKDDAVSKPVSAEGDESKA